MKQRLSYLIDALAAGYVFTPVLSRTRLLFGLLLFDLIALFFKVHWLPE